jgi:hypothetical protein
MSQVIIGMDPHKRSATIEVMASDETVVGGGRYGTDAAGYRAMLAEAKRWPERTWAIEGCQGIGRHIANRLLAAGEHVVDVPPKLSARTRVFATGQGRKTDATDAHSVALAATRMTGLRQVVDDQQLAVLRILADRRRSLGEDHTRMVSQLHHLLLELIAGGAKKDLSAAQAKALLARVRPRDAAGKARRRVAAELISDDYAEQQTGDAFIGTTPLSAWHGNRLMRHLLDRLHGNIGFLELNIHTLWSLIRVRPEMISDSPVAQEMAAKVEQLLDENLVSAAARRELDALRYAVAITHRY